MLYYGLKEIEVKSTKLMEEKQDQGFKEPRRFCNIQS